ncbi:hypothetical protein EV193_10664 [Herbihabitans rhizosphaerae]|uniref:VOC domain-containing protein n=1 Tax=Herbihabitans rhizosphaerae TaxID=1872711 RepID=A0A4Q7KLS7_9PSEU|nr:VOC family protein [Herbihabitans rhizosphaerae]RZS36830.1 hypothetical protein EV193_10664 [Herbihabitans rhizosphaerae]
MSPNALWLPYQVSDVDSAVRYFTDHIGLSQVDEWRRDGEHGAVLRVADGAYLEFVSPQMGSQPETVVPLAFELSSVREVDELFIRWSPSDEDIVHRPHTYPRGHYGFELRGGPAGAHVMVWSES